MKRLLLLVLMVVLGACTSAETASPSPAATGDTAEVPKGLAWSADLIGGGTLDGATLAGGDVALWFWAPW